MKNKPALPGLNVISLLLGAEVTKETLPQIMRTAKNSGATGLELTFHPGLLKATTKQIIKAAYEILPITALCVFFGSDDYDPVDNQDKPECLKRVKKAIDLASILSYRIGTAPVVTGPFGFQIEAAYDRQNPNVMKSKIASYLATLGEYANKKSVLLAHEILQPRENFAIQGYGHHEEILSEVGMPGTVGEHHDTFHADIWGESSAEIIRDRPGSINWLHASGSSRHSPGHASDHIKWENIALAFDAVREDFDIPICFEGFGEEFRAAVPEIGKGYPKDLPGPVAIAQALYTLRRVGMIAPARK